MLQNRSFSRALPVSLCLLTAVVLAACGGGYTGADSSMLSTSLTSASALSVSTYGSPSSSGRPADAGGVSTQAPAPAGGSPTQGTAATPTPIFVATATPSEVGTAAQPPTQTGTTPSLATAVAPGAATAPTPNLTPAPATAPAPALAPPPGAGGRGSATLAWVPPATDADGSAIGALAGFRIYYGTASGNYIANVFVPGSAASSGSVAGLASGTWYFTVAAVDSSGNESSFGYEMSKSL